MERQHPFPCTRVHYQFTAPTPIVICLEHDDDDNEVQKEYSVPEFYKKYPLATKCFSLQELLDAGIPIKQIDTHIYESKDPTDRPWTTAELLDDARFLKEELDKQNVEPKQE